MCDLAVAYKPTTQAAAEVKFSLVSTKDLVITLISIKTTQQQQTISYHSATNLDLGL